MAIEVHQPTPEQLANRRLLAQEVRLLVNTGKVLPSQGSYMYTPPLQPGEMNYRPCMVCAVGSVVVAAAVSQYPKLVPKEGVHRLTSHLGHFLDFHTSLADLVGFTFTEVVAFESAFMGSVIVPSMSVVEHMEGKGHLDLKVQPLGFTGLSLWRENLRGQLGLVGLIDDALEWNYWLDANDKETVLALMTLLESWETQPISYKRTKEA